MPKEKHSDIVAELLRTEDRQLKQLHKLVAEALAEEALLVRNLVESGAEKPTIGQRISDKVARFGGSWAFILSFLGILILWIAFNIFAATRDHFDPFPFILLNLVLSCIAALQAPVIMMSQNRQEEKDRQRAENDYLINLKSELELRSLHRKVDLLMEEQMIKMMEVQIMQLRLLDRLNHKVKRQAHALSEHIGKPLAPEVEDEEMIDFEALKAGISSK